MRDTWTIFFTQVFFIAKEKNTTINTSNRRWLISPVDNSKYVHRKKYYMNLLNHSQMLFQHFFLFCFFFFHHNPSRLFCNFFGGSCSIQWGFVAINKTSYLFVNKQTFFSKPFVYNQNCAAKDLFAVFVNKQLDFVWPIWSDLDL